MQPYSYKITLIVFFLLFMATLCVTPMIGSTRINLMNALSGGVHANNNLDANISMQKIVFGEIAHERGSSNKTWQETLAEDEIETEEKELVLRNDLKEIRT